LLTAENPDNSVQLPSHLTIRHIEQVYHQFEDALKGTGNLRIDASAVSKVDTAGIQLLIGLKIEMDSQHSAIEWISVTDELRHVAQFMGMQQLFEPSAFV
jgi:ABC-type transporter Mla MlaB component